MKNNIYIKQILIILLTSTIFGLIRNRFLDEPLSIFKEHKITDNIEGIYLPDIMEEPMSIKLELAYKLFQSKTLFIDARDSEDYFLAHIENAINVPYEEIDEYEELILSLDPLNPVVIYCSGGDCDLSINLGNVLFDEYEFERILIFDAGYPKWKELGYPIE